MERERVGGRVGGEWWREAGQNSGNMATGSAQLKEGGGENKREVGGEEGKWVRQEVCGWCGDGIGGRGGRVGGRLGLEGGGGRVPLVVSDWWGCGGRQVAAQSWQAVGELPGGGRQVGCRCVGVWVNAGCCEGVKGGGRGCWVREEVGG